MEIWLEKFSFYALSTVAILSALLVVTLRDAVRSALCLGLSLLAVAGLFASLGADFLFAAQIMVYVSGIAVLILFVVLIAGRKDDKLMRQINEQWLAGGLVSIVTFGALFRLSRAFSEVVAEGSPEPTTMEISKLLLGEYGLPFELVSVMLMAALLGAILFSKVEA